MDGWCCVLCSNVRCLCRWLYGVWIDGAGCRGPTWCMDMYQFDATQLMTAILDFHLLVYLATMDLLPLRVTWISTLWCMVLMDGIVQLYSVCISGRMVFRLTVQCIEVVTPYNDQFNTKHHMIAMLDFHLLVYLATMEVLPLRLISILTLWCMVLMYGWMVLCFMFKCKVFVSVFVWCLDWWCRV